LEVGSWKLEVKLNKKPPFRVGAKFFEGGSGKREAGSRKLEVGSWKLEVGSKIKQKTSL
jgi:hypothetical protein